MDGKTNPRELRLSTGLNQQRFWDAVGVTQSGGSRYESGRNMPRPVRELLRLVYIEKIDIAKVRSDDLAIAEFLKTNYPEMHLKLLTAVKANADKDAAARDNS